MARRRGRKHPTLGELIIEGAGEALAHKRGDLVARTTTAPLTVREVEVVPPPEFRKAT